MRIARFIAGLAVIAAGAGCADSERRNDLGTGLNTIDRDYMASAPETYEAALAALKGSGMTINNSCCDSLGGEIRAQRADGSAVRVTARGLDRDTARVTIRVEPGDAALAMMLHERTACELGLCEENGGVLDGSSSTVCYKFSVVEATGAARLAIAECDLAITHEEGHLLWADIEARQANLNPVQVRIVKGIDGCVDVSFYAGTKKSAENRELVKKLKASFSAKAH
ncbi:MAG: DUF3568 domain-containing protein [Planctomycetes bacterium]|nr:DUF3568 domain-containing protein [Planctomycetota bacterium]